MWYGMFDGLSGNVPPALSMCFADKSSACVLPKIIPLQDGIQQNTNFFPDHSIIF